MALNVKNAEVERLAAEVARLTGETKTEAIRRALDERRRRLIYREGTTGPAGRGRRYLMEDVWPLVPKGEMGRRLTRPQEDNVLGYGDAGA